MSGVELSESELAELISNLNAEERDIGGPLSDREQLQFSQSMSAPLPLVAILAGAEKSRRLAVAQAFLSAHRTAGSGAAAAPPAAAASVSVGVSSNLVVSSDTKQSAASGSGSGNGSGSGSAGGSSSATAALQVVLRCEHFASVGEAARIDFTAVIESMIKRYLGVLADASTSGADSTVMTGKSGRDPAEPFQYQPPADTPLTVKHGTGTITLSPLFLSSEKRSDEFGEWKCNHTGLYDSFWFVPGSAKFAKGLNRIAFDSASKISVIGVVGPDKVLYSKDQLQALVSSAGGVYQKERPESITQTDPKRLPTKIASADYEAREKWFAALAEWHKTYRFLLCAIPIQSDTPKPVKDLHAALTPLRKDVVEEAIRTLRIKFNLPSPNQMADELIAFFKPFTLARPPPPRGLCLWGPPGTGKTTLLLHLVERSGLVLVTEGILGSTDVLGGVVGKTESNVRAILSRGWSIPHATVVLMVDEVEALFPDREQLKGGDHAIGPINTFLTYFGGGADKRRNVHITSATNYIHKIDKAILRRIAEAKAFVGMPTDAARVSFLRAACGHFNPADVSGPTTNFTNANLAKLLNELNRKLESARTRLRPDQKLPDLDLGLFHQALRMICKQDKISLGPFSFVDLLKPEGGDNKQSESKQSGSGGGGGSTGYLGDQTFTQLLKFSTQTWAKDDISMSGCILVNDDPSARRFEVERVHGGGPSQTQLASASANAAGTLLAPQKEAEFSRMTSGGYSASRGISVMAGPGRGAVPSLKKSRELGKKFTVEQYPARAEQSASRRDSFRQALSNLMKYAVARSLHVVRLVSMDSFYRDRIFDEIAMITAVQAMVDELDQYESYLIIIDLDSTAVPNASGSSQDRAPVSVANERLYRKLLDISQNNISSKGVVAVYSAHPRLINRWKRDRQWSLATDSNVDMNHYSRCNRCRKMVWDDEIKPDDETSCQFHWGFLIPIDADAMTPIKDDHKNDTILALHPSQFQKYKWNCCDQQLTYNRTNGVGYGCRTWVGRGHELLPADLDFAADMMPPPQQMPAHTPTPTPTPLQIPPQQQFNRSVANVNVNMADEPPLALSPEHVQALQGGYNFVQPNTNAQAGVSGSGYQHPQQHPQQHHPQHHQQQHQQHVQHPQHPQHPPQQQPQRVQPPQQPPMQAPYQQPQAQQFPNQPPMHAGYQAYQYPQQPPMQQPVQVQAPQPVQPVQQQPPMQAPRPGELSPEQKRIFLENQARQQAAQAQRPPVPAGGQAPPPAGGQAPPPAGAAGAGGQAAQQHWQAAQQNAAGQWNGAYPPQPAAKK